MWRMESPLSGDYAENGKITIPFSFIDFVLHHTVSFKPQSPLTGDYAENGSPLWDYVENRSPLPGDYAGNGNTRLS